MKDQLKERWMSGKRGRILTASLLVAALVGTLIVVDGCAIVPRRRRHVVAVTTPAVGVDVVYVQKAPPKARTEVRPKKPDKNAVWIPGHWQWNGREYVWEAGHWETRPGGKDWIPGHWEKRHRGWVWVQGHWRQP